MPSTSPYLSAMRRLCVALSLFFIWLPLVPPIYANSNTSFFSDEVDADDETPMARVVRISLLRGDVWLQRAGESEWERATLNLPLVEGDRLATARDARLEIQFDRYNYVRLDQDATVRIVTLRTEGIALSLTEGTLSLRLARLQPEREYFEIDAPGTTIAPERAGLYRLDVNSVGGVRFTVREGGQARVFSERDNFTVRNERTVERLLSDTEYGDWSFSNASPHDYWDDWTTSRDTYIAQRIRERDTQPYDDDVWGAEELDEYGDWSYTKDYGWVWRPHVTVINNYTNWAPYRYGHWRWCPPYGWTWVGDEPWGWAPYHHGRWVYYDNNWCWTPRFYGYTRARWRPALVAFVLLNRQRGNHVAWYPLGYHQSYGGRRRDYARNDSRRDSLTPLRREEIARLERTNPARLRAVTSLPVRDFGQTAARARAAEAVTAREALASEPVSGRLPVIPAGRRTIRAGANISGEQPTGEAATRNARPTRDERRAVRLERSEAVRGERDVIVAARPPVAPPTRAIEERPTGAAARTSDAPLGEQLRRAGRRANREMRQPRAEAESGGSLSGGERRDSDRPNEANTGVFERPMPTARPPRERGERRERGDAERGNIREAPRNTEAPQNAEERGGNLEERRDREERREQRGDIFARPNRERRDGVFGGRREDAPERPAREERRPRTPDAEPPARVEQPRQAEPPRERPEPRPEVRQEPRPEPRPEPRSEPRAEPRTEAPPERERPPAAAPRERPNRDIPDRERPPDN